MRHAGLAPRSAWVLRTLEQADEPLTVADIGTRTPMLGETIRAALKALVAGGMVARQDYEKPNSAKEAPPSTYTAIPRLEAVDPVAA